MGTHIPSGQLAPLTGTHIPSGQLAPVMGTHVLSDQLSLVMGTHIPSGQLAPVMGMHMPSILRKLLDLDQGLSRVEAGSDEERKGNLREWTAGAPCDVNMAAMNLMYLSDFCIFLRPTRSFHCSEVSSPDYLSESFFMVKGAALFLQQGSSPQGQRSLQHPHKHAGDLPQHLQVMINLLRCEDRIKLAVRLESAWTDRVRYMVVVYSSGRQDTEENILLGVDFSNKESQSCTIGMVLRLWSDTKIHLDGDGGFSVSTAGRMHIFKPVSVQAMWSALQVLHKACEVARRHNYFPGGVALIWATYYESCISSEQSCINEWNAMQDLESTRPDSPALFVDKPTEGERTERLIKAKLRSIMMSQDLENVTSKEIRNELEKQMNCNLKEFKEFIDNEMLLILGQMDKPSLIFDHLYLGSEWNASNLEELQGSGVDYILNVTREIDNFFPGLFAYHNIRVYDEETTDLLAHWNEAYHFINKAKRNHSKCLVHCKMGVSRSASTVIAYAMKEFGWPLEKAYNYVKQKRSITRPNAGFMRQLSEYEGILDASKQRHNKLWRQQTQSSLQQPGEDPAGPSDFLPDTLDSTPETQLPCLDDATQPGFPGSKAPGGPALPCCFRRLSDPLLHSPDEDTSSSVQLDELERDALLEDAPPAEAHTPDRQPPESSGLCEKEVKKKLEFGSPKARGSFLAQEEEMERETGSGAGRWGRPPAQLNRENLNNNNSKRSCPDDFERPFLPHVTSPPVAYASSSVFALLQDDAIFGILNKVKPSYQSCAGCVYPTAGGAPEAFRERCEDPRAPAICTQPAFLPHVTSSPVAYASSRSRALEKPACGPAESPPFLPDAAPGVHHPAAEGRPGPQAHQRAGEAAEHAGGLGLALQGQPSRPDHTSNFSKDFLKTICYTPTSSSMSSNLTRSSSSDSIHSVRGKPGLVKQRTQEIETRLRLAGLTVSSPLKRSHSLAKLGSLNFSTEDLSSEADVSTVTDSQDAKLSESSFLHEPQATPRNHLSATSKPSGKSAPENLKNPSWMNKS
ncbi:Protein phosphatase Slingshot like protein 1 [Tupaia chinensis]|uniref:Protein phosphatase Slingshot homolog 1 n=1 Tax=Tupaia chinensis TaxID=246437 RepID=L9KM31_TUPCH|nr:Protein phosphatase Slingshot like protein 1 [Tupaia chinensis]